MNDKVPCLKIIGPFLSMKENHKEGKGIGVERRGKGRGEEKGEERRGKGRGDEKGEERNKLFFIFRKVPFESKTEEIGMTMKLKGKVNGN